MPVLTDAILLLLRQHSIGTFNKIKMDLISCQKRKYKQF